MARGPPKKSSLKSFVKKHTAISFQLEFLDECVNLCLSECELKLHRPIPHWMVSIGNPLLTRRNNFRIRLLVGCDGLEKDAARFSSGRKAHSAGPCCKLCGSGQVEDAAHFVVHCTALSTVRERLIGAADSRLRLFLPDLYTTPEEFFHVILGVSWIECPEFQSFCINFLSKLKSERSTILLNYNQGP